MSDSVKEKLKSPIITAPLLVICVIAATLFSKNALTSLQAETNIFVAAGVIQLATVGMPCVLYYLLKGRKLEEPMYILSKNGPQIVILLFACMFFVSGSLLIKFIYYLSGVEVSSAVNLYNQINSIPETATNLKISLAFILIPAIFEEILFRGVLFSEYRKYGTVNAVIVTSVCFALFHFSLQNFVIYFFTGLVLGTITAVSRSVIPSIALHLLSNTLNIYASDAFLKIIMEKNGEYFIGFLLTVLTGISLILLLSRMESVFLFYSEKPPVESLPPKSAYNWPKVFFSPTFILLIVIFIIGSLYF